MAIQSEEEFIDLVKKYEEEANNNPKRYTLKLGLFAILGYVVILAVLFSLVGLTGGLIATAFFSTSVFLILLKKKLIFVVLGGVWILLKALWVKFEPPEGYTLTRQSHSDLFKEIDALSQSLKALKIHEVILDARYNASVYQHPRLGILGWHKNYLLLGYELMLTVSPEEMRAILAHEFGHLSSNHSQFAGWIYRIRQTWHRVMQALDTTNSWGGGLMAKFFNWYSPIFDAYSFALARNNEYEADAISAKLTSPEAATRALVNTYATAPYVDKSYWSHFFEQADTQATPPHAPYAGLSQFLATNPIAKKEMLERIKEEMQRETHYADTHPSLKDRVEALGAEPQLPQAPKTSAAEKWLGNKHLEVMQMFDSQWMERNAESWKERYAYVQKAHQHIESCSKQSVEELNHEALWEYAYWTYEFKTDEAALPLFKLYQERQPEDSNAAYYLGRIMLNQQNDEGLLQLEKARKSAYWIEQVANIGYDYLKSKQRNAEAEKWWQACIDDNAVFVEARQERETITPDDQLVKPDINSESLNQLIKQLKASGAVKKAWLAEKPVKLYPENKVMILAFTGKGFSFSTDSLIEKVNKHVELENITLFTITKGGDYGELSKKIIRNGIKIL